MVQINLPHDNTQNYLNVKALCIALRCDPDLAPLPRDKIQFIFQMLYILDVTTLPSLNQLVKLHF